MRRIRLSRTGIAAATLAFMAGVGQPLSAQNGGVVSGTVSNAATGGPIANARVSVSTERRSYVTGGDGAYRLPVDSSRFELRVTAVGFAPVTRTVSLDRGASATVTFSLEPSAVQLDEVVTVGTRSAERTVTGSPVPVDVISSQMMENTGVVETWQQLQQLVPSLNVPHTPIADNGMRPVTLRGLAPHHVLVLVNGKRRHPSASLLAGPSVPSMAFTDVNAIPSSAIDRIEVLRDGESAQYGSDAIGGVVNIVLKSGERRDLRASAGQVVSTEGGRDFRDGRLLDVNGTFGLASRRGAWLTVAGEVLDRDGTNRAYPDARPQYFAGDPRNGEPPRISSYEGDGDARSLSLFFSAAAPIGRGAELYAFGGAADRNGRAPDVAGFRRPLDDRTVRAVFPGGYLPRIERSIGDLSALAGIRGSTRAWRWDLSSGWGNSRVAYDVDNTVNVSLGAASPMSFYAGRIAAQQWTTNLDVSRDVKVASIPVTVAGGAEVRLEKYQIRAGEEYSWSDGGVRILDGPRAGQPAAAGAQGLPGFRPQDVVSPHRSNAGLYLGAEGRPFQRLLLQTAARAERYSDFGSTSDGKLAARMELLRGVAVRGSISTGFRAPSLTQEYFSSSSTVFLPLNGIVTVLTTRTFPVNTAEARLMGATPLRPEKSVNASAGVVLSRPSLPVVTADYYEIKVDDRIWIGAPIVDTSIVRLFDENGMRGIIGGNYFTNAIDTRTRGVDVIASHSFLLSRTGLLRILAGYNHTKTLVTHVAPPPPQLARFSALLFNRTSRGIIEEGQPRQTITLGFDYSVGPLGLNLHNERSGPTAQLDRAAPDADQRVAAKWISGVRASYRLRSRLELALSAANLFDVYPSEWRDFKNGVNAAPGGSMQGIYRYPGALSAFGMNGRTLYLQMAYR